MARYDGLIIPRSYNEYINKTDAATLQQALQLSGVLSGVVAAGDNKAVKSSAVAAALTYQMATDCNACIPSAANKEAVFVLSNTASNLPSGESANQITFLLECKYSAGTTLGLYCITQVLYCHSNPMREYLRRGYSFDNGVTWTFNDWEKVITAHDLQPYQKSEIGVVGVGETLEVTIPQYKTMLIDARPYNGGALVIIGTAMYTDIKYNVLINENNNYEITASGNKLLIKNTNDQFPFRIFGIAF